AAVARLEEPDLSGLILDAIGQIHHDPGPLGRVHPSPWPGFEGAGCRVDRMLGIANARLRTGGHDFARTRIDALAPRTVHGINELSSDQHPEVVLHEASCCTAEQARR